MISDRFSPSRVRFAASRPGLLRADPKGWLFMREKGGAGVTLQIIWRKTLQAIWRNVRVWTNWRDSPTRLERSRWIGSVWCSPHLEENRPLRLVAAAAGIPLRTAQHWVEKYQQFGLAALARRKRADSGEHRPSRSKSGKLSKALLCRSRLPVVTARSWLPVASKASVSRTAASKSLVS